MPANDRWDLIRRLKFKQYVVKRHSQFRTCHRVFLSTKYYFDANT